MSSQLIDSGDLTQTETVICKQLKDGQRGTF